MESKKSYIPLKVFISYIALASLVISVGWVLYSENVIYSKIESKIAFEKTKILKVSQLFSNVYKTESLARKTIQSNSESDFEHYIKESDSLRIRIDSLKKIVTTQSQIVLLDSVNYLLAEKTKNIRQLKTIKSKANDEVTVNNAIDELTKLEFSLRKLQLEDFTKNPGQLGSYQRNVLQKYVDYLNQNIPDDSTNTLSKKASDSILSTSKKLLSSVKRETEKKKESLNYQENKLLKNEILISEQLRKVLRIIEREIIINSIKYNTDKEKSLKKINQIVTGAAVVGLLLTVFFSILIASDYSKTQLYKKQLEIANFKTKNLLKSREQLISTVSHDLKTPLSTIVGYTELLGNSDLNTKQSYFIRNIKNSSEYISQLVQDLLDFSQIEAGKIAIEKKPFLLPEIITDVAKNIQSVYKQKDIELIIKTDERLNQRIIGDSFRLKQILSNIIGNAYKFTEEGFIKIDATINHNGGFVFIKVEDSGIGIEKKNQNLVFEEFAQANENIEKKYGGTGLGLAISKKIATLLGGDLHLKSVFGKGSTFEIQLPLVFDTNTEFEFEETNKEIHIAPIISAKTAIVIDDDSNLLGLTSEVLKQHNYTVLAFGNANEALKAIENTPFDFIITDIQMPEVDGFQFLEKLKESSNSQYKDQPIIALTGRDDLDLDVYTNAGFTTVVKKPYSPKALLQTILFLFDNSSEINQEENESDNTDLEKGFSLAPLKSFLSNDKDALQEVLKTFIKTTKENLVVLEKSIAEKDMIEIRAIAHRIAPMFKQIQASEISKILDNLERKKYTDTDLETIFDTLKTEINSLLLILEKEIA
ncbi:ATP-binding protein [Flavobacterium hydatis]|uniref:histidine kinase n=1 Tax=Flavobacterium hydatis TaxID=991 RepID=A0A086AUE1_FLAHY|nr:ATP-binding protein [Flavobacterium hydatis]KFF20305.1 histidine kinase [Flavobacterium hydatis]OXA98404.1 hybrid sensor histidine kinase/response regulator [Flavobacterium hydatis]